MYVTSLKSHGSKVMPGVTSVVGPVSIFSPSSELPSSRWFLFFSSALETDSLESKGWKSAVLEGAVRKAARGTEMIHESRSVIYVYVNSFWRDLRAPLSSFRARLRLSPAPAAKISRENKGNRRKELSVRQVVLPDFLLSHLHLFRLLWSHTHSKVHLKHSAHVLVEPTKGQKQQRRVPSRSFLFFFLC